MNRGGVGGHKGDFAWEEFVFHAYTVAKGDFYLLGVQIRLLTRCKIVDVASC